MIINKNFNGGNDYFFFKLMGENDYLKKFQWGKMIIKKIF